MNVRKFLPIPVIAAMLLSMAACGGGTSSSTAESSAAESSAAESSAAESSDVGDALAGTYDITLWAPEAAVTLAETQVENFNSTNTMGITFNATVEPVSEADAATNMITDVSAGADLFFFAQDQLARLIQAGAVTQLGEAAASFVTTNNSDASIVAAQSGSNYYAYPLTADNGYFMYYDTSVIPEEDVDSLEAIIEDCEAAGKNISYELENAWYNAGFFLGCGCHSDWTTDDAGNFTALDDDFNSANGLIAAKGIYKVVSSTAYVNSSNADFASGSAVVVTGTWNYATIQEQLGDNFGVTDLPSFNVDGTDYHIGSYSGCKLLGVKPQDDAVKGAAINQLAQYLTGKDCQLERFSELGWGPSNKEALEDSTVQADPTLMALNEQNQYATPQPNIHGSWWDIAKVITTDIRDTDGSDEALQAALDKYEESAQGILSAA